MRDRIVIYYKKRDNYNTSTLLGTRGMVMVYVSDINFGVRVTSMSRDTDRIFCVGTMAGQFALNLITIPLFISLVICEGLLVYIHSRNPYNFLNKLFIVFLFLITVWIIAEIGMAVTSSEGTASWFLRIGALGWNFMVPVFLVFILVFVKQERLVKNFLFLAGLFGASMIFLFLVWRTDFITSYEMKHFSWAWQNVPGRYLGFYGIWVAAIFLFAFFLVVRFYLTTRIPDEKRQATLLLLAMLPSFITGMLGQIIIPVVMGERSFLLDAIAFPLSAFPLALFLGIAVIKYKLFIISPSLVIPSIIDTMAETLIVFNPALYIEFVNRATLELFGYSHTTEIIGKRLNQIIAGGDVWETFLDQGFEPLKKGRGARSMELKFLTRDGKEVPVHFSASPLRTPAGEFIGVVALMYDIGETKKLTHSLEEKLAQLREAKHNLERTLGQRLV